MPAMTIVTDRLQPGDILAEHSYKSLLASVIRWGLTKWERRVCDALGVPPAPVDTNHNGICFPDAHGHWYVGEALANGNVATPMSVYQRDMDHGQLRLRFFRYRDIRPEQQQAVVEAWHREVEGHPYDYRAYWALAWDCVVSAVRPSGKKVAFYCTEGCERAYHKARLTPQQAVMDAYCAVGLPLCQDETPTPMHIEQVAGLIPHSPRKRVVLREITSDVVSPTWMLCGPAVIPQVG